MGHIDPVGVRGSRPLVPTIGNLYAARDCGFSVSSVASLGPTFLTKRLSATSLRRENVEVRTAADCIAPKRGRAYRC